MFDNISNQYEAVCSHIEDLLTCIENVKLHQLDGERKSLEQSLKYNEQVLVKMEKKYLHLNRPDHLYHLL